MDCRAIEGRQEVGIHINDHFELQVEYQLRPPMRPIFRNCPIPFSI